MKLNITIFNNSRQLW